MVTKSPKNDPRRITCEERLSRPRRNRQFVTTPFDSADLILCALSTPAETVSAPQSGNSISEEQATPKRSQRGSPSKANATTPTTPKPIDVSYSILPPLSALKKRTSDNITPPAAKTPKTPGSTAKKVKWDLSRNQFGVAPDVDRTVLDIRFLQ